MRRWPAGLLLACALTPAGAQDAPVVQPTRDVDVTYRVPVPGGADASLLQRLRWSASRRQQRVDMPGNWMVLDFAAHRMALVRDESREVVDLPSPQEAGRPGAAGSYARAGSATVEGLACTEWRTLDLRGQQTLACYTDDGVLLRATAGSRVLMQAIHVTYGPQPPDIFVPPAGYTHQQGR